MSFRDYMGAKALFLYISGIVGLYLILVSYFCGVPFSLLCIFLLSGVFVMAVCAVIGWRHADRRLRRLKSRL